MKLKHDIWNGEGITVAELIAILAQYPGDTAVTRYEDEVDAGFAVNQICVDDEDRLVLI